MGAIVTLGKKCFPSHENLSFGFIVVLLSFMEEYTRLMLQVFELSCIFAACSVRTVKPMYNDHLGDEVSAVVIDRWSL